MTVSSAAGSSDTASSSLQQEAGSLAVHIIRRRRTTAALVRRTRCAMTRSTQLLPHQHLPPKRGKQQRMPPATSSSSSLEKAEIQRRDAEKTSGSGAFKSLTGGLLTAGGIFLLLIKVTHCSHRCHPSFSHFWPVLSAMGSRDFCSCCCGSFLFSCCMPFNEHRTVHFTALLLRALHFRTLRSFSSVASAVLSCR